MFELLISLLLVIVLASVFLIWPLLKGESIEVIEIDLSDSVEQTIEMKRRGLLDLIAASKALMKDLELENEIGKVSKGDFETLRKSILKDWGESEASLKELPPQEQTKSETALIELEKERLATNNNLNNKDETKNIFCTKCGTKTLNPDEDKYCRKCGVKL